MVVDGVVSLVLRRPPGEDAGRGRQQRLWFAQVKSVKKKTRASGAIGALRNKTIIYYGHTDKRETLLEMSFLANNFQQTRTTEGVVDRVGSTVSRLSGSKNRFSNLCKYYSLESEMLHIYTYYIFYDVRSPLGVNFTYYILH